jgi:glycerol-3-phosphate dehydrogenase (NAD(P)+)
MTYVYMSKIALIGYGTWGKAMLKVMSSVKTNNEIIIYSRQDVEFVLESARNITNERKVAVTNNLVEAIEKSGVSVIATRAQEVSNLISELEKHGKKFKDCIITSKGFSANGSLLSDEINDFVSGDLAILSGPNFASEIAEDKITLSTIASTNAIKFKKLFDSNNFKTETCDDIIGVQVCSILKNIFAIGCGIVVGAFNSENTKAAFITKAFRELKILIESFGGQKETIYTVAGIGDLMLTCYSRTSRNHEFGYKFITNSLGEEIGTVEGLSSLEVLRSKFGGNAPLCKGIYDLLHKKINVEEFGRIIIS